MEKSNKRFSLFKKSKSGDKEIVTRRRHSSSVDSVDVRLGVLVSYAGETKKFSMSPDFNVDKLTVAVRKDFGLGEGNAIRFGFEDPVTHKTVKLKCGEDFERCWKKAREHDSSVVTLRVRVKARSRSGSASGVLAEDLVSPANGGSKRMKRRSLTVADKDHLNVLDLFSPPTDAAAEVGSPLKRENSAGKKSSSPRSVLESKLYLDSTSGEDLKAALERAKASSTPSGSASREGSRKQKKTRSPGSSARGKRVSHSAEEQSSPPNRSPRNSGGRKGSARSSVATRNRSASCDVGPDEMLLASLRGDGAPVPVSVLANLPQSSSSTIRRPKAPESSIKSMGRSLEDFAKILSADSMQEDAPLSAVPSRRISKGRRPRPHSIVLSRGTSTMSIPTVQELAVARQAPRVLVHQRSLQEMETRRASSALGPRTAPEAAGSTNTQRDRAESISHLRQQHADLQAHFPSDLEAFFERKRKHLKRELARAKQIKYKMMMPSISMADLAKSKALRPTSPTAESPTSAQMVAEKKPVAPAGLAGIIEELCEQLTLRPDNATHLELANAVCMFSPRFEGGPVACLIPPLRKHYRDASRQAGAFALSSILMRQSMRFSKGLRADVLAAMEEFASKDMSAVHRHGIHVNPDLSASSPQVARKPGGSNIKNWRKVITGNTGRPLDFADVDVKQLADALMAIDFENLLRVSLDDFLLHRWESGRREDKAGKPTRIFVCVKRWVHLGDWVASEIVCTASMKQRVGVMRRMVDLASELWIRGDFQSSMAVVSALQSASVARLKETWKGLSSTCLKKFDLLSQLCGPERHFAMYREELDKRFKLRKSKEGVTIMPFLGLITQELTSLGETATVGADGKLNVDKIVTFYRIINRFFDAISVRQLPTVVPDVLAYSVQLTDTLSEEQLYQQSILVEPLRVAK